MGFIPVSTEQALADYEARLDAMGLKDPQRSVCMDVQRAGLEYLDSILAQMGALADPMSVLTVTGAALDAFGARSDVNLKRDNAEPDHDYRMRLIERMRDWVTSPRTGE